MSERYTDEECANRYPACDTPSDDELRIWMARPLARKLERWALEQMSEIEERVPKRYKTRRLDFGPEDREGMDRLEDFLDVICETFAMPKKERELD